MVEITYNTEAYTKKELTLSKKMKDSVIETCKSCESCFGSLKEIVVCGKWYEPFPNINSKTLYPTWRIQLIYTSNKTSEFIIHKKAIYYS